MEAPLIAKADEIKKFLRQFDKEILISLCAAALAVCDPEKFNWKELIKQLERCRNENIQ